MNKLAPVQRGPMVPWQVAERAYEVYTHLFGRGQSLERLCERGGFSVGELSAFLFAHAFPKQEWEGKVDWHLSWQGALKAKGRHPDG